MIINEPLTFRKESSTQDITDKLNQILEGMINNNFTIDPISYNSYIEKYAYNIDGNVSTRCLDYIKGLE